MSNEIAVFAGGCFWCTETVFKMLKGVSKAEPGYARGRKKGLHSKSSRLRQDYGAARPTYEEVSTGETDYAESVRIEYDPEKISYRDLLTVFFASHDPTTPDRQGSDIGHQYRSAIFYVNDEQKEMALNFIKEINSSLPEDKSIDHEQGRVVTEVSPLGEFHAAEDYHRNYFERHRDSPYCELVINPKLEKVQKKFAALLNIQR